jgi:hypothetical protein
MKGPRPTGLLCAFDDEIVDHHAHVPVRARQDQRGALQRRQSCVYARDDPLRRGFLVAGRS